MSIKCDVLVVGAGPAGSSAARAAAKKGLKTIFIDKREEIGNPALCAEGVGGYLLPSLPFKIPKEYLLWKIDGILFLADGISIEKTGDFWQGYSVDRTKFDKWVSEEAVNMGAKLWKNAELLDLELDEEDNVKTAIVKKDNKNIKINPKIVIAADGSESTVLKSLDLYHPKKGDHAEVYSWEMTNLNIQKPHYEQIYTGTFTPCGYAYVFPKSKDTANIGVGGICPEKKLEQYFEEFLEIPHVKKQTLNANYTIEKSKKATWNNLTDKWIINNVVFTGDAANQNLKPFIEGILPAMMCGDIAGKVSYDLFSKKNVSHKEYYKLVNKTFDIHFEISNQIKEGLDLIFRQKDPKKYLQFYGIVTELLDFENVEKTFEMNYDEIKSMLLGLKNGL